MKTEEAITRVQSIADCFAICRVYKKEVYVPIDEEDVEALKMAVAALKRTRDAEMKTNGCRQDRQGGRG